MLIVKSMSLLASAFEVTVNVYVVTPASSSTCETSSIDSDATSSFKIVPMPCVSAIVTAVPSIIALDKLTAKVSSSSTRSSPTTSTAIVVDVDPAMMVAVCGAIAV